MTAINFITNKDFQEKHENELTVNDDVNDVEDDDDQIYKVPEPDFNMSEINKYLEKGGGEIEEKSNFNMSEINKYLLKEEEDKPDFDMSEINKYLDKPAEEEEE